jgi:hypothetical protein
MTTFITVFVAFQLFLGFCALLFTMQQPEAIRAEEFELQRIRVRSD